MAARTARTSGILTAALLLAGAMAAPSAGATEDREAAAADLPHCVMDTRTGTESCFASFPQAIAAATGGQVTDVPFDATGPLPDASSTKTQHTRAMTDQEKAEHCA